MIGRDGGPARRIEYYLLQFHVLSQQLMCINFDSKLKNSDGDKQIIQKNNAAPFRS